MSASLSIAFIGTGVMGRSMAGHLLKAGHTLHVHNRTKAKAAALLDAGAHWHDTPGAAAAAADFVITIVGFPQDVEPLRALCDELGLALIEDCSHLGIVSAQAPCSST